MYKRRALSEGCILPFPGMECRIVSEIGRGSNAIVYRAWYSDSFSAARHEVLVKELFPFHPQSAIYRDEAGRIVCTSEGREILETHRLSFEAGNAAHLSLLEKHPDDIGANLNTFEMNGTLYTVLGFSGGRSMSEDATRPALSLRPLVERMLRLLDSLESFHDSGLLHLDIAPDNVLLIGKGQRERAMLIDYNSCQRIGVPVNSAETTFSIKPGYTAPEIRSGRFAQIGPWSDIYSVTALFFQSITGAVLTPFQMMRPAPPNVSNSPCIQNQPDTVKHWTQEILRRGLSALPAGRYQNIQQMRDALNELLDRIDCVGITHWSLWESGLRNVDRMIRDNPALAYIRDEQALYPARVENVGESFDLAELMKRLLAQEGESKLLMAPGGMGKSTALLRCAWNQTREYAPFRPAMAYVPLFGWREGNHDHITDCLLETLRFKAETTSFQSARKALKELLDQTLPGPDGSVPVLLLLLDGLNEAVGDTQPLLEEIQRLDRLQGVRILVTSRTETPELSFSAFRLTELRETDVQRALSEEGLLMPESTEVQALLRTPLMLSIFIQSSRVDGRQLSVSSQEDLLEAYFRALREKAQQNQPENADDRWQLEAALRLVLPAMSRELRKKQRPLTDAELLPAVERCYRLFRSRMLLSAFPDWIGHTGSIRGTAKNAEEWYGRIVHELLWQRLGLVVRDEEKRYLIAHQIISDYLYDLDRENRKRINHRRRIRQGLTAVCVMLVVAVGYWAYDAYIKPKPYREKLADAIMDYTVNAYVDEGLRYEYLNDLNKCAMDYPDTFEYEYLMYLNKLFIQQLPSDYTTQALHMMLDSGEVMPWSGKPMEAEACEALLTQMDERGLEYDTYADVLYYVMTDPTGNRRYADAYTEKLSQLLNLDARINATLFAIVDEPHLTGKYADGSATELCFDYAKANAVAQNEFRIDMDKGTGISGLKNDLVELQESRRSILNDINTMGALADYAKWKGQNL